MILSFIGYEIGPNCQGTSSKAQEEGVTTYIYQTTRASD
jgi:hypothetical protein